ncbi:MOSC domain-containing protein [Novipirellula artificiosorum]|uniref:6-N-hydroxylaminopurine resistance protein n=1 Tax=Novipirellula artificiosorum TaxID=2528016 RepID=A0A5C6DFL8_9BACT|nr:MOSC domain-containing protein [Novipirellula artificiosorum]TWU33926.1 6-N-hydroxylaminopurine resistance protein [Novipirellula artificiosorum]
MRQVPSIFSIQVGLPRVMADEREWTSGFLKESITELLWLGTTNLQGDAQADLVHHGGPHKAVCVYSAVHYPYWRKQLQLPDLLGGDFGENFTVAALRECDVCIGDTFTIGDCVVQVSQPRQPCWKLARRWGIKDLALQVQQTGFTGWYFRVLTEGHVQRGMELRLVDRLHAEWTIEAANQLMHHDKHNQAAAARLAAVPELSPSWQATLSKRADTGEQPDEAKRLG